MRLLILLTIVLTFSSFVNIPKEGLPIKTNYLVGSNIYEKAAKQDLDKALNFYLKDKSILQKVQLLLKGNDLKPNLCFAIYNDANEYCNKNVPAKATITNLGNRPNDVIMYGFIYICGSGTILAAWIM